MTFAKFQEEIQKTAGKTDPTTLAHIKEAINLGYRKMCGVSPLFWAREQKDLTVNAATQDYDLDATCRQVLGIRPAVTMAFEITLVDREVWDEFVTDFDAVGNPVLAKVEDRGAADEMHLYFHPIPDAGAAGTYKYDAMLRPTDMSADGDEPIFGSEWDTVLIAMARAELFKILGDAPEKIQSAQADAQSEFDRFTAFYQRGADGKGA